MFPPLSFEEWCGTPSFPAQPRSALARSRTAQWEHMWIEANFSCRSCFEGKRFAV